MDLPVKARVGSVVVPTMTTEVTLAELLRCLELAYLS